MMHYQAPVKQDSIYNLRAFSMASGAAQRGGQDGRSPPIKILPPP